MKKTNPEIKLENELEIGLEKNPEIKLENEPENEPEIKLDEVTEISINPVEDNVGNVITPVIPITATVPEVKPEQGKIKYKGKASMITSIICFVIGLIFLGLSILFYFQVYSATDAKNNPIGFVAALIFVFTYGFLSYLPSFGFGVAGIISGIHGASVAEKGIKISSIIFLVLNAMLLVALFVLFILLTISFKTGI